MFRRSFLIASSATLLTSATALRTARSQIDPSQAALEEVKAAILKATKYHSAAIELTATKVQIVVTVVNSGLVDMRAVYREVEARRIVSAIARTIKGKPELEAVQALHIDYVKRGADGGSRTIDAIDFRKDPQGTFQHHIT